MGEYYDWVNVDKKEYISPFDFDLGNKLHESAFAGNPLLGALYSLLASEWKGDAIVFLGDETNITKSDKNPVLRKLSAERESWGGPGYDADYVYETYKCISGIFKDSEGIVRHEIDCMVRYDDFSPNYYGVKKEAPYEGLFIREPLYFRYTINHTKKEYFDIERTRLTYKNRNNELAIRINPLPLLMAFPGSARDDGTGVWIGDDIEVSDLLPSSNYIDKSETYGWNY